MMKKSRIYSLAYSQALMVWDNLNAEFEKHPDNSIIQHKVEKAWEELVELRSIIIHKGYLSEI